MRGVGPSTIKLYFTRIVKYRKKYSVYDREFLSKNSFIRHFRFMLEGRTFTLYTGHKHSYTCICTKSDKYSTQKIRKLRFISQFATDIRHVKGVWNMQADTLSQTDTVTCLSSFNCKKMAEAESFNSDLQACLANVSSCVSSIIISLFTTHGNFTGILLSTKSKLSFR